MYPPSKILLRIKPCFRHPDFQHSKKTFFLILSNRIMTTVIKFCWDYFFIASPELIALEATSKGQLCNHQHNKFLFCKIILIFHTVELLLSCWSQTISNFWNIPIRTISTNNCYINWCIIMHESYYNSLMLDHTSILDLDAPTVAMISNLRLLPLCIVLDSQWSWIQTL